LTLSPKQEKEKPKERLRRLSQEVERNWNYWRPIAYGVVKMTKEEYDSEGPQFLLKLKIALNHKAHLEKEAFELEKRKTGE
jgi:hypothetical protein